MNKWLALFMWLTAFCFGFVLAVRISYVEVYKQGQLDYQAGKIEWTMIDGKLHHIQEGE